LTEVGDFVAVGVWTQQVEFATSVLVAAAVGLVLAGLANNDSLQEWLRSRTLTFRKKKPEYEWSWTWRTSFPSEWYSAFSRREQYVVLHLADDRRLYGFPEEWPDQSDAGHFVITEAEWLVDGDGEGRLPIPHVEAILIPASKVEMVEFMEVRFQRTGEGKDVE